MTPEEKLDWILRDVPARHTCTNCSRWKHTGGNCVGTPTLTECVSWLDAALSKETP